mgnify:CR=1 FL=1
MTMTNQTTPGFKFKVLALVALAALLLGIALLGFTTMQAKGNGWAFESASAKPVQAPPVQCLHNTKDGDIGCPGNSK